MDTPMAYNPVSADRENNPVSADRENNPVRADGENNEGNQECAICISEMVNPVKGTFCERNFCEECLEGWIKTRRSTTQIATCPVCRSILTEADLLVLQLDWNAELMVQRLEREENFNFMNDV